MRQKTRFEANPGLNGPYFIKNNKIEYTSKHYASVWIIAYYYKRWKRGLMFKDDDGEIELGSAKSDESLLNYRRKATSVIYY